MQLDIDSLTIKTANDKYVLSILFYNVDSSSYFHIYTAKRMLPDKLKGYSELNNFEILYLGIDDQIAGKFMNIEYLDWNELEEKYKFPLPCFHSLIDPEMIILDEYYCKINHDGFEVFTPDENHFKKLDEELIIAGMVILPPPPPIEN